MEDFKKDLRNIYRCCLEVLPHVGKGHSCAGTQPSAKYPSVSWQGTIHLPFLCHSMLGTGKRQLCSVSFLVDTQPRLLLLGPVQCSEESQYQSLDSRIFRPAALSLVPQECRRSYSWTSVGGWEGSQLSLQHALTQSLEASLSWTVTLTTAGAGEPTTHIPMRCLSAGLQLQEASWEHPRLVTGF